MLQIKTDIPLDLIAPQDFCCNCGQNGALTPLDTPIPRTKYFLFLGTETVFHQTLPYCKSCKSSAIRVRPSIYGKLLVFCFAVALLFVIFVFTGEALPSFMQSRLFASSVVIGAFTTTGFFYWTTSRKSPRTYYQPVRLLSFDVSHGVIEHIELGFENARYAALLAKANPRLVETGALEIVALNDE